MTEEEFDELRPSVFAIAYRMLGSVSEAEDVVQEGFLRLHRAREGGERIESPRAYLSTVVSRLSLDHLRSARVRRETYVGEWLPELASALDARPPRRVPRWLARLAAGEAATLMMTEVRGASNAKAKRELGWQPRYPSWRQGFAAVHGKPAAATSAPRSLPAATGRGRVVMMRTVSSLVAVASLFGNGCAHASVLAGLARA